MSVCASAREFVLATTEWPPYACESCEGQGAAISILKKHFKSADHELRVVFYPWSRSVQEARKGRVQGVWPAWQADLAGTGLIPSEIVFHSPLGVAERVDHPLKISSFRDLQKVLLGVVRDYGYSAEYLELVRQGILKPESVRTDIQNIEKLGAKRIDATLIDAVNFRYLVNSKALHLKNKLQMNKKVLAINSLAVGLNPNQPQELQMVIKQILNTNKNLEKEIQAEADRLIKNLPPQ